MKKLINSVLMAGVFAVLMALHPDCANNEAMTAVVLSVSFGVLFVPVYLTY